MATTQTNTNTGGTRRRTRRTARYETPVDLLRDIVQRTCRFDTRQDQITQFVKEAREYAAFVDEALDFFARLKFRDVAPLRPAKQQSEADKAREAAAAAERDRKLGLGIANRFLKAKLSNGKAARDHTGPELRAEGGKFIKIAKSIPRGKVLDDVATTDDQRLAIAAVLMAV